MANFIHFQAEDVDDRNINSDNQDDSDEVSSYIDNTNYKENLSKYYGVL